MTSSERIGKKTPTDKPFEDHKVKQQVVAERLDAYVETHSDEYERVRFFEVRTPIEEAAERLVAEARKVELLAAARAMLCDSSQPLADGALTVRYAGTLPPPLRTASSGEIIGPYREEQQYLVAEIYGRQAARLDSETHDAVQEAVYQEWLAEQRARATIQWHWI